MVTSEFVQSLIDRDEGSQVEFKLDIPPKLHDFTKEVCAFANAGGGYILIGVADDGQIAGVDISNARRSAIYDSIGEISPALRCELSFVRIAGKTVYVLEIPVGSNRPYVCSGCIWVRNGSNSQKLNDAEEIRSFFQECDKIFFDSMPCLPCGEGDLSAWYDADMLETFRAEARLSQSVPVRQIFENLHLLAGDSRRVKNGAVLFFGRTPETLFPHAVIRCVLFKGTSKVYIIDSKTFGGPLYRQYTGAMAWLESKMQLSYEIDDGGAREEKWEIPLVVFREALINALAHRDYYERGATVTVEMFDDRIEISNPGGLLPVVARDFGRKSLSRNPLVFELFMRMHLVEKVASGIPRMCEAMQEAGLPAPEFRTEQLFTVIFKRQEAVVGGGVWNRRKRTHRLLLDIIRNQPGISAYRMAVITGKDIVIVKSHLNYLLKQGLIEFADVSGVRGYALRKEDAQTGNGRMK